MKTAARLLQRHLVVVFRLLRINSGDLTQTNMSNNITVIIQYHSFMLVSSVI